MGEVRDLELWHAVTIAVLNYLGDPRGFLADQPELDRATAGYVFLAERKLKYFIEDGSVLDHDPGALAAMKSSGIRTAV